MKSMDMKATDIKEQTIQVVAFHLGMEEYAVDILNVMEIIRLLPITRVPRADQDVEGVVNLRGNIIPVINLHRKFNIGAAGEQEDKRIIVFQFEDLKAGIIVDKVSEVLHVDSQNIEDTAKVYDTIDAEIIEGVAKVNERLLILLDLQRLLGLEGL